MQVPGCAPGEPVAVSCHYGAVVRGPGLDKIDEADLQSRGECTRSCRVCGCSLSCSSSKIGLSNWVFGVYMFPVIYHPQSLLMSTLLRAFTIFWVFPVSFFVGLVNIQNLSTLWPGLVGIYCSRETRRDSCVSFAVSLPVKSPMGGRTAAVVRSDCLGGAALPVDSLATP